MYKDHSTLWAECLSFIKDNIGADQYEAWFAPISSLSYENNELRLVLPSPFFVEYIELKYVGVLGAAIKKVFGDGVQLFYHYNVARDEPKSVVEVKSTPASRAVLPGPDKQIANPFTATRTVDIDPQLNPRYTFENYCSSDSNKIAVSIAESIAHNPVSNPFNPLFVFGLSSATASLLFYLFAVINGLALSPIFVVYTGASIAKTFFITAGVFGAMSVYGYFTSKDLSRWGSILTMALFGLIIVSVVNIFLKSTAMEWIISGAGVLIFIGLTAWDTQQIKQMALQAPMETAGKLATLGALSLYLDFINLFLYLLRFFGNNRN